MPDGLSNQGLEIERDVLRRRAWTVCPRCAINPAPAGAHCPECASEDRT